MALNNFCIHSPSPHIHINKAAVVSSSNAFNWIANSHILLAARCFWLFPQIARIMRDSLFLMFYFLDALEAVISYSLSLQVEKHRCINQEKIGK